MIRQLKLVRGKVRRFALNRFRKEYVTQQKALLQGECNHCGNCCEILIKCPFLLTQDDGSSQCSIYEDRPGQCAAFPIDARDLVDVDFDCTHTFAAPEDLVGIEAADQPSEPSRPPAPPVAPERLNPARSLPVLLLQRLLNRAR